MERGTVSSRSPLRTAMSFRNGVETSNTRNAPASATVIGNPRARRFRAGSWRARGERFAKTIPTTTGTASARKIQPRRTADVGTYFGSGTNASTKAASFGATMPTRSSGQAVAAARRAESQACSRSLVLPKRARTAQPRRALKILPAEREMRARIACKTAMLSREQTPRQRLHAQHHLRDARHHLRVPGRIPDDLDLRVRDAGDGLDLLFDFAREGARDRARGRRQRHLHVRDALGRHAHVVDQPQLPDVHRDLGVE